MALEDLNKEINSKIEDGTLLEKDFQDYSNFFCWYCGHAYPQNKKFNDKIVLSRYESKIEGPKRVHRTEYKTINIPQCYNCYQIHEAERKAIDKFEGRFVRYYVMTALVIATVAFLFTEPWIYFEWSSLATIVGVVAFISLAAFMGIRAIAMIIFSKAHHKKYVKKYHLRERETIPAIQAEMKNKFTIAKFD